MQKAANNKAIIYWLLSGALLVLAMVAIGGITRLTGSGLSIVQWNLISGTLPPLTEAAWQQAFAQYKQFPEYQKLNQGMTLQGFQQIFWWEYLHRLVGRLIGLVFLLPFCYFLIKRWISGWLLKRLLLLFFLGAAQGLMGWVMVKSGLVDRPHVSHYRLAAHLTLALSLIGVMAWTIADLVPKPQKPQVIIPSLRYLSHLILVLVLVQIIFGAFVAGLKAGFSYNTYPLMEGELFPSHLLGYLSWSNTLDNGVAVQFLHRWFALLVLNALVLFWYTTRKRNMPGQVQYLATLLLLAGITQLSLGIATLVLAVPLALSVLHQVVAVLLFVLAVLAVHSTKANRLAGERQNSPASLRQQV
ncbi:cytochrome c oxidase assembly protein subunit 15 [Pontibacter ummariensis]|uniref:Cytochrome c oxidase assembly protein subunit 15 n=1 Tax=Pontibacter ummariensis TaxID=1610492 RepID=A0A239I9K7_9BACT|nr:COX15/CtaA family protein [Pontibacter ummariensis]PRY09971.1 cytochrome c oxidase assembly protein subunit 15 [Pontibacter ummariensis]SNS90237.1 cytochrome c oxidase assembly protein subunit 15 [Pontibacter ummariensis]